MSADNLTISRWVFCVLALSVISAWPMLLTSSPLVFHDTKSYLGMGEQTWAMAKSLLSTRSEPGHESSTGVVKVKAVRAVTYSVYLYFTSKTILGLVLPVFLQTALTIGMFWPFVREIDWHKQSWLAFGLLFGFSTLPWIASYAMPDILAAAIIIWCAILVRSLDKLSRPVIIALTMVASFAVSSHYGHIPLAALLTGFVVVLRLIQKRMNMTFILVAPIPVLAAVVINLSASAIALDKPSFAPKRLPILLARSLEDGPAAWFLEEHCDGQTFAMCEEFGDNVPQNISEFLWAPDGISSISADTLDRIRAEETAFLLAAFKEYPIAQLWSFAGNAMMQIVTVGTDDLFPTDDFAVKKFSGFQATFVGVFDWITKAVTLLSFVVVLVVWKRGKLSTPERDLALLIVVGLIANAVIFGGLSAPVDRYQSRVAWLLPALWFIHAVRRRNV